MVLPLLIAGFLAVPQVNRAHAQLTGLVCITTSTTATSCPTSAPTIGPLTVGSTLSVGVFIQGSDPMAGFDIYVSADPAYLNPTGAVLGSLIASPTSTTICVNDISVAGSCSPNTGAGGANAPGVVEVNTFDSSGNNECSSGPCSGMAFTIDYKVVGETASTLLSYPSAAFCNPGSVQASPSECVLVDDNVGTTLLETSQGATATIPPSLVSVVVGTDSALYWNQLVSSSWTGWQPLGGSSSSPPGLCSSGPGDVELVVRGVDNGIYHKSFVGGTWSVAWDTPGGATADQPSCAVLNGVLYVIVRGSDNGVYANSRPLPSGSWSGWAFLGGATLSAPVLVATPSANRLDLVVRGLDDGIYHMAFVTGAWSFTWDAPAPLLSNQTPDVPVAVSDGTSLQVVVRGEDNGVYYNQYSFASKSWFSTGWSFLGGATTSAPSLVVDSSGTIHLVVRALDDGIYHKTLSGGTWSANWDSPGGATVNTPAQGIVGSTVVLVVEGSDGGIYYNAFVASAWTGWTVLTGSTATGPGLQGL